MRTVEQLVRALLPDDIYGLLDDDQQAEVHRDVVDFVQGQINGMPKLFSLVYRALLVIFDASAIPVHGRPFRFLGPGSRRSFLGRWSRSPLPVMNDFVKLVRSLTLLCFLDHPMVLSHLMEYGNGGAGSLG